MSDISGQATALTVLTPILDGHEDPLRAYLDRLPLLEDSPLARLGRTHFARFIVLHDLVYQGPPQERDSLASPYLLFTSNLDGDVDSYLRGLAATMGAAADAIWSHCVGYPGSADAEAFAGYLTRNRLPTTFFVAAYPEASVVQVRAALAIRARLTAFAVRAQDLPPAQVQAAFRTEFADLDRHCRGARAARAAAPIAP